jgi:hypothetical protein
MMGAAMTVIPRYHFALHDLLVGRQRDAGILSTQRFKFLATAIRCERSSGQSSNNDGRCDADRVNGQFHDVRPRQFFSFKLMKPPFRKKQTPPIREEDEPAAQHVAASL